MWTCSFTVYDEQSAFRRIVVKNKIDLLYYPINHYMKNNRFYFVVAATVRGKEQDKKNFFRDLNRLKKSGTWRKIESLEIEKDLFILITSQDVNEESKKEVSVFYNKEIIHYQPILFRHDGWEEWEVASLKRKNLEDLLSSGTIHYRLKLRYLKRKKITQVGFFTMLPTLSVKQEHAVQLALEQGYYTYPRKTSLKRLATLAGLSFSTFQAHVRKAENKILTYTINMKKRR